MKSTSWLMSITFEWIYYFCRRTYSTISVDIFLYWTIVYVKTSDCFVDNVVYIFSDFPKDSPPAMHLMLCKGRGNKREL